VYCTNSTSREHSRLDSPLSLPGFYLLFLIIYTTGALLAVIMDLNSLSATQVIGSWKARYGDDSHLGYGFADEHIPPLALSSLHIDQHHSTPKRDYTSKSSASFKRPSSIYTRAKLFIVTSVSKCSRPITLVCFSISCRVKPSASVQRFCT
jgi:hypothetical protein